MRKTLPLLLLVFLLTASLFASNTPRYTFSSEFKLQSPLVDLTKKVFASNRGKQNIYATGGVSAEVDYRFFNAGISLHAGKDTLGKAGFYPSFTYGLFVPIKNSKIVISRGYSLVEKGMFFRLGYSYYFKNGITIGVEANNPSKFNLENKKWTELNHLKETLIKTQFVLKAGYSPKFASSAKTTNTVDKYPSNDWYFKTTQSILFSSIGFYNQTGKMRLGVDLSMPIMFGVATYLKDYRYRLQILDASLFTSVKFDLKAAYEFPIGAKGFKATAQAGITSLWFNGEFIDVPAYYQAYSLTTGGSIEYWVNSKNGFIIESNIPTLTFYFNKGETSPRVRTVFNDNNVKTAVNYMTRVGYVHKI